MSEYHLTQSKEYIKDTLNYISILGTKSLNLGIINFIVNLQTISSNILLIYLLQIIIMRKSLHIFLAFLLLFSTTGVAISKHYCGEILQSVSINGETKSCCDSQD